MQAETKKKQVLIEKNDKILDCIGKNTLIRVHADRTILADIYTR